MNVVDVGAVCRALGMDGTTWGRKERTRTARSPTSSCYGEVARAVKNTRQERQRVCQGDRVFLGESGPLCEMLLRAREGHVHQKEGKQLWGGRLEWVPGCLGRGETHMCEVLSHLKSGRLQKGGYERH